jgi:hypothetical protein
MALWLFRKTGPGGARTRQKVLRDRVYLVCGVTMLVALALAGIAVTPVAAPLSTLDPEFWLESVAIVAFGVSWLVKGQAVLRDRPPVRRSLLQRG